MKSIKMSGIHDPATVYVDSSETCISEHFDLGSVPKRDFSINHISPVPFYPSLPITSFTIQVEPQNTLVDLREICLEFSLKIVTRYTYPLIIGDILYYLYLVLLVELYN